MVKQINAQVANWPLIITEYRNAAMLRAQLGWNPGHQREAGRPAVHLGRDEHHRLRSARRPWRADRARCHPTGAGRRTWWPSSTRCCGLLEQRSLHPDRLAKTRRRARRRPPRPRPHRPTPRRERRSPRHNGRSPGRRQRARQADHRAPPAGRPPAIHPDRRGSRRVRSRSPCPHEPPRRARILQVVGVTDPLKLGFQQMAMIGIRCEGRPGSMSVAEEVGKVPPKSATSSSRPALYDILIETVCEDNDGLLRFLAGASMHH